MNEDDLRTQLRRELDAAPAWPLDPEDAARRANPHHRRRTALTMLSVVIALGVTAASVVVLASLGRGPHGIGTTTSAGPTQQPAATTGPASPEPSPPATTASFTCDGSSTVPADVTVAAARDGIRIVVDNTTGSNMGFEYDNGGATAPPGEHVVEYPQGGMSWPLAPGDYHVKCLPDSVHDPDTVPAATLRVVDPNGYWVSSVLQCTSGQQFGVAVDFAAGAGWESIEEATHHALDEYAMPGDVIARVGYPDENEPQFVVVRDRRNIVITQLYRLQGKWLYSGIQGCTGEDRVKGGFQAPIRRG